METITSMEEGSARKQRHLHRILIKKYSNHLVSTSSVRPLIPFLLEEVVYVYMCVKTMYVISDANIAY